MHGALFVSWTLLFFVQTALVARRRADLHQRLGIVGGVLAAAIVVAGTAIAIVSMRYNFARGNTAALSFFAIPIANMLVFPILVAAAIGRQAADSFRPMWIWTSSIPNRLLECAVCKPWLVWTRRSMMAASR